MHNIGTYNRSGVTLIELMVATAMSVIVMFGVAVMFYNGQKGWDSMYGKIYSDVVTNSFTAKKMFDTVVRKSSITGMTIDEAAPSLEVHFYDDPNSVKIDRYGRFYCQGNQLIFEYGNLDSGETLGTVTMCGNVAECSFKQTGRSIQMILTLERDTQRITTVTSAVLHNL